MQMIIKPHEIWWPHSNWHISSATNSNQETAEVLWQNFDIVALRLVLFNEVKDYLSSVYWMVYSHKNKRPETFREKNEHMK